MSRSEGANGSEGVMDTIPEAFLSSVEPRLREALVAAYGLEVGVEACADAVLWGWEHHVELASMQNPAGYLFRVGQSAARSHRRRSGFLPQPDPHRDPEFEPGLVRALERLSEPQRVTVVAVHSLGWSLQDVADFLEVSHSTVRTHMRRGMTKLRSDLEVESAG